MRNKMADDLWETNQKNTFDQMTKFQSALDSQILQHQQNAITHAKQLDTLALVALANAADKIQNVNVTDLLEAQVVTSQDAMLSSLAAKIAELILAQE